MPALDWSWKLSATRVTSTQRTLEALWRARATFTLAIGLLAGSVVAVIELPHSLPTLTNSVSIPARGCGIPRCAECGPRDAVRLDAAVAPGVYSISRPLCHPRNHNVPGLCVYMLTFHHTPPALALCITHANLGPFANLRAGT